eukprot:464880_1
MAGVNADISDIESSRFVEKKAILHGYEDSNTNYRQKYSMLKLASVASICLLLGLVVGSYLQQLIYIFHNNIRGSNTHTANIHTAANPLNDHFTYNFAAINRGRRTNEDECSKRRCCNIRDDLTINDLPDVLNCKTLTDDECGEQDAFCEWNCQPPKFRNSKRKIRRKFRRISLRKGRFQAADPGVDDGKGPESYEKCLSDGKLISVDDCGVEYEEELDQEEKEAFCRNHPDENASRKGGVPSGDTDDDEGDAAERRLGTSGIVLGEDDRESSSCNNCPHSTVLYLTFNKPAGGTYRCTATMISPLWAITAAHCVYGGNDWYQNWIVWKNVHKCSDLTSTNRYYVQTVYTFTNYINTPNTDNDIAFFKLWHEPNVAYLSYLDWGHQSLHSNNMFNIVSYPADKSDCTRWHQYCPYNDFQTFQMSTQECDTSGGASGSPLYKYWSGSNPERIIFAIHSSGDESAQRNYASRITTGKYNAICEVVEMTHANHCDTEHDETKHTNGGV